MQPDEFIQGLKDVYEMLEDQLSKELYLDRLNWLVTGNFGYVEHMAKKSHPDIPVWNGCDEKDFIKTLPEGIKITFYGTGSFSERLIPYLKECNLEIEFCDSDIQKQKKDFYGYRVISPMELFGRREQKKIVICTTKYMKEVKEYLINHGVEERELMDIRSFFKCGTGDDYFYEDFLHYLDEEIFVDAGCYDLGTTYDFAKLCGGLKKVYAFEPDPKNYENCLKRLEREKESFPEISLFPYGTWSCSSKLPFASTADGCAHIGEGKCTIKTAAIDDVVDVHDKITFIKMDVEGAELESLKGAEKIIKRDKPKLAICIYHKPEDIVTLPLYMKALVYEYKFYLRSYSNADNEMVLYAIP